MNKLLDNSSLGQLASFIPLALFFVFIALISRARDIQRDRRNSISRTDRARIKKTRVGDIGWLLDRYNSSEGEAKAYIASRIALLLKRAISSPQILKSIDDSTASDIYELFMLKDKHFIAPAIRVLGFTGRRTSLTEMRRMIRAGQSGLSWLPHDARRQKSEIMEALIDSEKELSSRMERLAAAEKLLRPSDSLGAEVLLRPAGSGTTTDNSMLPRPAEPPLSIDT